jgi:hypothetical protein
MNIPIDYNKMQAELDKRHYMSQVYISSVETWKPTELGLKTYGKWCDLVGWKNLYQEIGWSSTDDFMNLAIKRKWVERYWSFEQKQNVCSPTKFGHDLFRTFEYWIDVKAQKKAKQKATLQKIAKSGMNFMAVTLPQIIQGITEMMAGLSKGFEGLDYQDPKKQKQVSKPKKRGNKKFSKSKKQQQSDNYTGDQWQKWANKWNKERKGDWSQLN